MAVIALASAKGAPGVTTSTLALAWAWPEATGGRRLLVVDADMAGGDISTGYLRGAVPAERGLLSLAAERTANLPSRLLDYVISLDAEQARLLLTGISDRSQARSLSPHWSTLAQVLKELAVEDPPFDVLLDLGRLGTTDEAVQLRERADLLLLVTRSSLTATATARSAARWLVQSVTSSANQAQRCGALIVGAERPYGVAEITAAIDIPVMTTMAWDPSNADVLSTGRPAGWGFARSALMRSARRAVIDLYGLLTAEETPTKDRDEPLQISGADGRRRSHG